MLRSPLKPLATLTVLAALSLSLAVESRAQSTPSQGVRLPDRSLAVQSDAASTEVNPAGLAFMDTLELGYTLHMATRDASGVVDDGHAVFAAAGLGPLGLGVSTQWITRPDLGQGLTRFRRHSLAGALRLADGLSVGLGYHVFGSDTSERLDNLHSVDVGLQWRLGEHLALAAFGRDLNAPFLTPTRGLGRRFGAALALRLWDGRVILEQEAHLVQGSDQLLLGPRLALEPLSGLRLFARAEIGVRGDDAQGLAAATAGVELSLGSLGVQSSLHMSTLADARRLTSHSHSLWFSPNKQRPLFDLTREWIVLDLSTPFSELPVSGLFGPSSQSYLTLLLELDRMTQDDTVEGLVLNIAGLGMGYGQIWELRQRLDALRQRGKHLVAVLQSADTRSIYLANAAHKLYMVPHATYEPSGLSAQLVSYGGLLDRFKIKSEFLRVRDYKTAPEQYTHPRPSPQSLEQTGDYLDELFKAVLASFHTRAKTPEDARAMVDQVPLLPAQAKERGYIDRVLYADELEAALKDDFGPGVTLTRGYSRPTTQEDTWRDRPEIAIVVIDGAIITGKSGQSPLGDDAMSGSTTLIGAIDRLRRDQDVKAVVVRINSPGGSAVASDLIYRELRRLAQTKPVLASMGNVAASGGYYVAVGAEEIFATPLTLTGSIGIFAGKVSVQELAQEYGVDITTLQRGQVAGALSLLTPWSQEHKQALSTYLLYLYRLFLRQAAATRPLSADQIDALGQGRVWTGSRAKDHKLIDQTGSLIDALRKAEQLAGLSPRQARYTIYPEPSSSLGLPGMVSSSAQQRVLTWLGVGLPPEPTLAMGPRAPLAQLATTIERAALLLLYYPPGEALMLPPVALDVR